MYTGTLALALAFTLSQAPGDVYYTNQRAHKIPVEIPPENRQQFSQLRLYASTDNGRSWNQMSAVTPDKDGFIFQAKDDGPYWFRVASVNLVGKQDPENLYQGPPDQKMFVDTRKPAVEMSARRQGDEILATWSVQEDYPDMRSMKLEYRAKDGPPTAWYVAPFDGNLRGQTQFRVSHQGAVILRLHVQDLAGNVSYGLAEASGVALASGAPPAPLANNSNYSPAPSYLAQAEPNMSMPPEQLTPPPSYEQEIPPPSNPIARSQTKSAPQMHNPGMPLEDKRPLATSVPPLPTPTETPLPPQAKHASLPQINYLNSTNLTFEYEISKLSPSGIGVVDVYWTLDDGRNWEHFADDPKSGPSMLPGRYKRRIELPGDGVYGFTCVALSRAAKEMREKANIKMGSVPKSGDTPEIRVEVDTVPPLVELFAPVPDKQRENTLILSWTAKDKNLASEPISLEWAENPEGPWQACSAKQSNTGRFSWTLPQRIPVQVYLRVRAADLAGNEGIAVTQDPLYVDLGQPTARFTGVFVTQQAP